MLGAADSRNGSMGRQAMPRYDQDGGVATLLIPLSVILLLLEFLRR